MASFTLQHDPPKERTQEQEVIEYLSRYITAVDKLVAILGESPGLRNANEMIRLTMEMGHAKGNAKLAGYIWPE